MSVTKVLQKIMEKMMEKMLLIRGFEERVQSLFLEGKIHGTTHLAVGQEAVAVGVCSALGETDWIIPTHRCHSHAIAKSGDVNAYMCEIMGKRYGSNLGLGGSMHLCDMGAGVFGSSAIVGGTLPLALGVGMALRKMGTDQLAVCLFGDGAANQGAAHEAMNMAAIWKLPVLFLCENNLYGISMKADRAMTVPDVADRGEAYRIPSRVVDGNQVMEVYEAVLDIAKHIRRKEGPWLLECKTYRWLGHSKSDERVYRTAEEEREWKERCPIKAFRAFLLKEGILSEAELERMQKKVSELIEAAVRFAEAAPVLDIESALNLVYA
ncbi:MAG: thiamine pyrophosphate-dependent dehydrogenase E1 component subunit alpha [Peptococcaceae bacterium]|jgi:TPP-dependent pyruvate/acetoin dehydrogenase alpha subunit|nr:thiamine pyrophosphate-dependent dehydrogenase E1 component subunit alpha [Peptococcaceae bacterium]